MLNCKKENCTGCGVCAYSCPKSAINMVESVEGFLYPKVDRSLCVDCNLCNKVCPSLKKPSIGDFADCYAVQLINKTTLRHCASGGAFYGIAQTVLEQNGAIFGVVDFGTELRYQKATSLKELDELTGSKYFQCAISEKAYGEIIESTQKGLTLVSGTPCMVAAIRNLQRIMAKYTADPVEHEIPEAYLADETFAAILEEAEKYIGYPYVWGGYKPSTSFDCSGFVSYVYNQCGWDFGRLGAQGLYNISRRTSSPRPGDLVFFTGTYDTPGVSHVGIYVGDGWMLHCGDPIGYANLNTSYWQSHFYAYGRLS